MRTVGYVEELCTGTDNTLEQLRRQKSEQEAQVSAALNRVKETKSRNEALFQRDQRIAARKTDWLFGLTVVLLTAAFELLLLQIPYFGKIKEIWDANWNAEAVFRIAAPAFLVLSFAEGWLLAAKKNLPFKILLLFWAVSGVFIIATDTLLFFTVVILYALVSALAGKIRKALLQQGKYKNIFHRLERKAPLQKATAEIAEAEAAYGRAKEEVKNTEKEIAEAEHSLSRFKTEITGLQKYAQACETTKDYPQSAVKAYGQFVSAYTMLGELGNDFFELRTRMENEDGETLYRFALELSAANGDLYAFLRFLQIAVNKGCIAARTALGGAMAQISAAADAGRYSEAYAILQPLIETGSADALNIKLQLDNNRQAEAARKEAKIAREEAAAEARRQNSILSAAQQSILNEMTAIRHTQEFGQQMMFFALEDARRNGIKLK